MRHGFTGRRFARSVSHRKSMFANLAVSLHRARADRHHPAEGEGFASDRREAGDARQARRPACAPPGDCPDRQRGVVKRLFDTIAPRYATRNGGYLRIMKAGFRHGDNAAMAVIEFVDRDTSAKGAGDRARIEAEGADEEAAAA